MESTPSFEITITTSIACRADLILLEELKDKFPQLSRARLKHWFQDKKISLGKEKLRASTLLQPGTHFIRIERNSFEDLKEDQARPSTQGCFLPIIYESESLLILNKASGTPSVPHSSSETETAVGAALAHRPSLALIGKGGLEPAILHRLDTGTSGLLAFAKTEAEFERLKKLWSTGQIRKKYRALVSPSLSQNTLPKLPLELRISLAHDEHSSKRMIALSTEKKRKYRGKPMPTMTHLHSAYFVQSQEKLFITPTQGPILDLEIDIQTGVMHQIRCTLENLGFPILGDPIYHGKPSSRLWLHAWKLEIPGENGQKICVIAPLPDWPKISRSMT